MINSDMQDRLVDVLVESEEFDSCVIVLTEEELAKARADEKQAAWTTYTKIGGNGSLDNLIDELETEITSELGLIDIVL